MTPRIFAPVAAVALLLAQADPIAEVRRQFLLEDVRANDISVRRMRGVQPSPEEAKIAGDLAAKRAALNKEYASRQKPADSVGITALNDLGAGTYKGEQGGLYPGGKNEPPAAHQKAGVALARRIVPLDPQGHPSPDGRIGFISIGYSNWTQEFSVFVKHAMADPDRNPKVAVVDCAQSGQTSETSANPKAEYWNTVDARLEATGLTRLQVQVIGFKVATLYPVLPFPQEPKMLQGYIVQSLHNLQERFPNLKIAFLHSRIYGGYADTALNPEPHAFETGFGPKWTIAAQIAGDPELNYDPAKGKVRSPWIAWGPYFWADGMKGRGDGVKWFKEDLSNSDHTHPSDKGREKIAAMLLDFVKRDPAARPWFVREKL